MPTFRTLLVVVAAAVHRWSLYQMDILRYLRGTSTRSLLFSVASKLALCAYSNADWAGDPTTRKSATSYCIFLGDFLISWRSKKQDVIALSSTDVKYRAMSTTSIDY
ncbi:uncharacterized protein LOC109829872 [Asparagus officinalis]|uniref:uncharacterized protein LOC109829872 n=1 Tax=Asparagus officinalis TaxID=4686 RepID=UPI00098E840F|nr:uncharacterized protein LOC109829872 [Asparagus officinalis]